MPTVRDPELEAPAFVKTARPVVVKGHGSKESQCDGKRGFEEFSLAEKAAKRRKRRSVYKCRFCRAWHVGTRG